MTTALSPKSPRKGKHINLRVVFLDDLVHAFPCPVKSIGQVLWDAVIQHLSLLEADYFDLQFSDELGQLCWLDRDKQVTKQLPNPDSPLTFCVKFYTPDPGLLEDELTRYLFALQIKRDLATGIMPCSENTAALLASYIVQAEIGDFLIDEYTDCSYLSDFNFIPHQTHSLLQKIMEYHKQHIGETPNEADSNLLDTARKVEMFGIRLHPAKDHEGVSLSLAVAHMGVLVFQTSTKINTFSWAKIRKLSFKRKKFLIKLHPDSYGFYKDTVEFFLDTRNDCKAFWKKCIEHHAFFRCQVVRKVARNKTRVVSRGSSFRYSGRTQKQLQEFVRENIVKRPDFERSTSGRLSSRSTSVTPKTNPKTAIHNSSDIHNSTASSGSHILDPVLDNHVTPTRVEMAEVHSDSSMSGSRSLGSPKLEHGMVISDSMDSANHKTDEEMRQEDVTNQKKEAEDKGGDKLKTISNNVDMHFYSANQNANDNEDDLSEDSYHLDEGDEARVVKLRDIGGKNVTFSDVDGVCIDEKSGKSMKDLIEGKIADGFEGQEVESSEVSESGQDAGLSEIEKIAEVNPSECVTASVKDFDKKLLENEVPNTETKILVDLDLKVSPELDQNANAPLDVKTEEKRKLSDDLIEDIPYYLHRRLVEGEQENKQEISIYTAAEMKKSESSPATFGRPLNEFNLPKSKRSPSPGGRPKLSKINVDQLRHNHSPSPPTRRSRVLDRTSPCDRSPSLHRRLELVNASKLPPRDSFSSIDDTTSPSFEKDILKQLEDKSTKGSKEEQVLTNGDSRVKTEEMKVVKVTKPDSLETKSEVSSVLPTEPRSPELDKAIKSAEMELNSLKTDNSIVAAASSKTGQRVVFNIWGQSSVPGEDVELSTLDQKVQKSKTAITEDIIDRNLEEFGKDPEHVAMEKRIVPEVIIEDSDDFEETFILTNDKYVEVMPTVDERAEIEMGSRESLNEVKPPSPIAPPIAPPIVPPIVPPIAPPKPERTKKDENKVHHVASPKPTQPTMSTETDAASKEASLNVEKMEVILTQDPKVPKQEEIPAQEPEMLQETPTPVPDLKEEKKIDVTTDQKSQDIVVTKVEKKSETSAEITVEKTEKVPDHGSSVDPPPVSKKPPPPVSKKPKPILSKPKKSPVVLPESAKQPLSPTDAAKYPGGFKPTKADVRERPKSEPPTLSSPTVESLPTSPSSESLVTDHTVIAVKPKVIPKDAKLPVKEKKKEPKKDERPKSVMTTFGVQVESPGPEETRPYIPDRSEKDAWYSVKPDPKQSKVFMKEIPSPKSSNTKGKNIFDLPSPAAAFVYSDDDSPPSKDEPSPTEPTFSTFRPDPSDYSPEERPPTAPVPIRTIRGERDPKQRWSLQKVDEEDETISTNRKAEAAKRVSFHGDLRDSYTSDVSLQVLRSPMDDSSSLGSNHGDPMGSHDYLQTLENLRNAESESDLMLSGSSGTDSESDSELMENVNAAKEIYMQYAANKCLKESGRDTTIDSGVGECEARELDLSPLETLEKLKNMEGSFVSEKSMEGSFISEGKNEEEFPPPPPFLEEAPSESSSEEVSSPNRQFSPSSGSSYSFQNRKFSAPVLGIKDFPERIVEEHRISRTSEIENIPESVYDEEHHNILTDKHTLIHSASEVNTKFHERENGIGEPEYRPSPSPPPPPPPPIFEEDYPPTPPTPLKDNNISILSKTAVFSPNISTLSSSRLEEGDEDTKKKSKRYPGDDSYYMAKELLMTERTYKKDLEVVSVWFRNAISSDDDILNSLTESLFSYLDPIYEFHVGFLKEVENRMQQWEGKAPVQNGETCHRIGDLLLKAINSFEQLYQNYLNREQEMLLEIDTKIHCNKRFEEMYKDFESQKVCYLPLNTFFLKPGQRLLHYKLILERLIKFYPPPTSDLTDCREALAKLLELTNAFNDKMKRLENVQKLMELQRDLVGIENLVNLERSFLREGCLQKYSRKGYQQRMFFLFSDMLVYTSRTATSLLQFKVHGQLSLKGMLVEENEQGKMAVQNSFAIYAGNKYILVAASSQEEKDKWIEDINEAILQFKNIPDDRINYPSLKSSASSSENVDGDQSNEKLQVPEKQIQHRANTTMHVCWHRNTSVSMRDHSKATRNQLSGYLLRKFKNSNGWQKLWVVFTNFCLFFYKSFQDDFPLASLPLLGYAVSTPEEDDGISKDHVFKLQFKNHIYFFRAESEYTFIRWMEVINSATHNARRLRLFSRLESEQH